MQWPHSWSLLSLSSPGSGHASCGAGRCECVSPFPSNGCQAGLIMEAAGGARWPVEWHPACLPHLGWVDGGVVALCHPDTHPSSTPLHQHQSSTHTGARVFAGPHTDTHLSQTTHTFRVTGLAQRLKDKSKTNIRKGECESKRQTKGEKRPSLKSPTTRTQGFVTHFYQL